MKKTETEKAIRLYENARNGTLKQEILSTVKQIAAESSTTCEMIHDEQPRIQRF